MTMTLPYSLLEAFCNVGDDLNTSFLPYFLVLKGCVRDMSICGFLFP
jgi:hypothetical protein